MSEGSSTPPAGVGDVLDEYLRALAAGETPDRRALLARHPEMAEELSAALLGLELLQGAVPSLTDAGPDGVPAGRSLGDYRLLREVGRGGMAVVYEAEQISLGRRVALKVLPFAAVLDPKALQRFKNEAMAAAQLRHPNIVPVYAVGCERGVHYYAMQFVEGQSLAAAIRDRKGGGTGEGTTGTRTPISTYGSHRDRAYVRLATTIAAQAARALDHAHQFGVVHRDVKPANLLLDAQGTVWVTDFGLASSRADAGLTVTGELLGTIRYMSPEQALAKRVPVDHRTDVWSLGATLYELLTLEHAFPGDDPHRVIQDVATKDPAPPRRLNPSLPHDLETIVLKALTKDPAARYATAQELADDLERLLGDVPVRARRPTPAARAAKWARRHKGLVAAGISVVVVGSAALAVGARIRERDTRDALGRAETNLALARRVADEFLVEAGLSGVGDVALRSPARRQMVESALGFYERYVDDPTSPTRAALLHALHRYDDSLAAFETALKAAGERPHLLAWKGHVLWHLGRLDEALTACRRAVEVGPDVAEAHYFLGTVLEARGQPKEGLVEYDAALALDDTQARFHGSRAEVLGALGRSEDAIAAFEKAISIDPTGSRAHNAYGILLDELGRLPQALRVLERAVVLEPDSADLRNTLGNVLKRLGRLPEAMRAFDKAIELDPKHGPAWSNRGTVLEAQGEHGKALESHDKAVAIDPKDPRFRANRGMTLASLDRLDDAVAEYDEAIRLRPDHPPTLYNRGVALSAKRDFPRAIADYRRALEIQPRFEPAILMLGTALAESGDPDHAIDCYENATAIDRDDAAAWGGLGNVLRARQRWAGAAKAYTEVIRINPGYAVGHYCLGDVLEKSGNAGDAIPCYRKAAELKSPFADAHRNLGRCLREKGLLVEAAAAYRAAIAQRPDFAEAKAELGRTLAENHEFDAAVEACLAAIRDDPGLEPAHLNLGVAYLAKGEREAAIAAFREALRLLDPVVRAKEPPRTARGRHDAQIAARVLNGLGAALVERGETADAEAALREAIRLEPRLSDAHGQLADLAAAKGADDEAIEELRKAVQSEKENAVWHSRLGGALLARRRPADALLELRLARTLGARRKAVNAALDEERIAEAEHLLELEGFLDRMTSGAARPRDALERARLAGLLRGRNRPADALREYEAAFAEEPALQRDLAASFRYDAACCAVAAAAAGGADAAARRARAFAWLRADLEARAAAASALRRWRVERDLAPVRDRVDDLPAGEREGWRQLWADVEAAVAREGGSPGR